MNACVSCRRTEFSEKRLIGSLSRVRLLLPLMTGQPAPTLLCITCLVLDFADWCTLTEKLTRGCSIHCPYPWLRAPDLEPEQARDHKGGGRCADGSNEPHEVAEERDEAGQEARGADIAAGLGGKGE